MQVLGINEGPDPLIDLELFIDAFQITFPVLLDDQNIDNLYRFSGSFTPFPLDYVIDQNGNVAYQSTEYEPDRMIAVIDALLGLEPAAVLSPTSLDFGEVPVGQTAQELLTVQNTGTGELQVFGIAVDNDAFGFNLASFTVPPGGQRSLVVTFSPAGLGPHAGVLTLDTNDPVQNQVTVTLSGTGDSATAAGEGPPVAVTLSGAPNPFNPRTELRFTVTRAGPVRLEIHDARGRIVRRLLSGETLSAGAHAREWDGRDESGRGLASGIYLVRLSTGDETVTHKLTLVQ